jgi:probable HAF family extracellular repeat protein
MPYRKRAIFMALFALAFASLAASGQTITCKITSFRATPSNAVSTEANALNDNDVVAGTWSHLINANSFETGGFLRYTSGQIVPISVANMPYTYLNGINDSGTVVGYYQNSEGNASAKGLVWSNGVFSNLQYPDSVYTMPYAINKSGEIVGWYAVGTNPGAAFLYSNGQFTSISYPGAFSTTAMGINNSGEIVGYWEDSNLNQYGFTYINGTFQSFSYPGQDHTYFTGVNDAGVIVGYYLQDVPYLTEGFVYKNAQFYLVNIPDASASEVLGINQRGDISGVFDLPNVLATRAFIGTGCQ